MTAILGTDANTAYRIAMDDDGNVMVTHMMSTWNVINRQPKRHGPEDLPATMRREGCYVISDETMTPMRLRTDDIISESFRLVALHTSPDEKGWFNMTDIARTAYGIGFAYAVGKPKKNANFSTFLQKHPSYETYTKDNQMYVRGRPTVKVIPVNVKITCPDGKEAREGGLHAGFGAAFKSILAIPQNIISHRTVIEFTGGDDRRVAIYDATTKLWIMSDGSPMKTIDPTDPVLYSYKNGRFVNETIGFVAKSQRGRIFGNIGIPRDSEGDDDASIQIEAKREFDSFEAALLELKAMTHLAHVFEELVEYEPMMGFWLSSFKEVDNA